MPTPTATASLSPSTTPAPVVTTAAPTRPPTPSVTPSPRAAGFRAARVTAADLPHSWHEGCPVPPSQLRRVTVPYVDFDGRSRRGELIVHQRVASQVGTIFTELAAAGVPIRSIRPVDDFGGSDDASMAADNTSAFNCRDAVGGSGWSQHAYGLAIDVNPRENPYLYDGKVLPPEGEPFVDRSPLRKGMIGPGGAVHRAFTSRGWGWGGAWRSSKDYQHFSKGGG